MQYSHGKLKSTHPLSTCLDPLEGISAAAGKPFSPPIAFRTTTRPNPGKNERTEIREAKCHKCKTWVAAEGIKDIDVKVRLVLASSFMEHCLLMLVI